MNAQTRFPCGHPRTSDNIVTVRGRFEYCRICTRQSANRRYRGKHPGAPQRAFESIDAKLSTFLIRTPSHWLWQGQMRDNSTAVCAFDSGLIFVAQHLWEKERGAIPARHCLYRMCSHSRCVRPQCRTLKVRGAHISSEQQRARWNPDARLPKRYIYGMSPEAAALFGLIDDEQYLARYRLEEQARPRALRVVR
jgi:hypothetical protein